MVVFFHILLPVSFVDHPASSLEDLLPREAIVKVEQEGYRERHDVTTEHHVVLADAAVSNTRQECTRVP